MLQLGGNALWLEMRSRWPRRFVLLSRYESVVLHSSTLLVPCDLVRARHVELPGDRVEGAGLVIAKRSQYRGNVQQLGLDPED